jgi:2-keto-4-pentenoate hydratase
MGIGSSLGVVMEKNGEAVAMASSAAVMEHPAEAVALLAKVLAQLGEDLPAGSFVIAAALRQRFLCSRAIKFLPAIRNWAASRPVAPSRH